MTGPIVGGPLGAEDIHYQPIDPGSQGGGEAIAGFLGRRFSIRTVADMAQPVLIVGDATTLPAKGAQEIQQYYASGRINRLAGEGNVFEINAPGQAAASGIFSALLQGFLQSALKNLSGSVFQGLANRETQGFLSDFAIVIEDLTLYTAPGTGTFSYVTRFDDGTGIGMLFADANELVCAPTNQDTNLALPGVPRAVVQIGSRTAGFIGTPITQPNAPSMPFNLGPGGFAFDPIGAWVWSDLHRGVFRPLNTPFLLPPGTSLTVGSMAVENGLGPPAMGTGGLMASVSWREIRVRE